MFAPVFRSVHNGDVTVIDSSNRKWRRFKGWTSDGEKVGLTVKPCLQNYPEATYSSANFYTIIEQSILLFWSLALLGIINIEQPTLLEDSKEL